MSSQSQRDQHTHTPTLTHTLSHTAWAWISCLSATAGWVHILFSSLYSYFVTSWWHHLPVCPISNYVTDEGFNLLAGLMMLWNVKSTSPPSSGSQTIWPVKAVYTNRKQTNDIYSWYHSYVYNFLSRRKNRNMFFSSDLISVCLSNKNGF